MKHLGDITKISGVNAPFVDCVFGGSPCQDLSVAGKRAGMMHSDFGDAETTRSGLFMEQIRIIKEMRESDRLSGVPDRLIRPRYMVWENVPGAFSSKGGGDKLEAGEAFRIVLEETARVAEHDAVIPRPPKEKWRNFGTIMGDGWSIAWRVFDAQFWGVPQRRRRIALVADFGGQSAPEILFERKGLRRYSAESGTAREKTSADAGRGTYPSIARSLTARNDGSPCIDRGPDVVVQGIDAYNHACTGETAVTLTASSGASPTHSGPMIVYSFDSLSSNSMKSSNPHSGCREVDIAKTLDTTYPDPSKNQGGIAILYEPKSAFEENWAESTVKNALRADASKSSHVICLQGNGIDRADTAGCNGKGWREDVCYTLNTIDRPAVYDCRGNGEGDISPTLTGDHQNRVTDYTAIVMAQEQREPGSGFRMTAFGEYADDDIASAIKARDYKDATDLVVSAVDCRNFNETGETFGTLQAKENGGQSLNYMGAVRTYKAVRRLTPLECERLQGFPDGWTYIGDYIDENGKRKTSSDSARYKALGNSIALPNWKWIIKRISAQYERDATMASLFDGIGGFPLIWEQINGKGSCLWASEIEPFPIAVTKYRFEGGEKH